MKRMAVLMLCALGVSLGAWGGRVQRHAHARRDGGCAYCARLDGAAKVLRGAHLRELKRIRARHVRACHGKKGWTR